MKYILALDQGTTGNRAIAYDRAGTPVASAYEEFPQYFPSPGLVEHDPEEIWTSMRRSIGRVLRRIPGDSIAAIGITNQRETTVVWDRATGTPVHRAIVWQCRRTSDRCARLARRKGMPRRIRERTGLPIDAYFSASKIEWILKHGPGATASARRGDLCFGTTDTWLLWKLTGGAVHATDYTNASRTMIFNIDQRAWDPELLDLFHVPPAMLPRVKRSSGSFGTTVRVGRLPAGIPISGIAGDQQAALFGQACFRAGSMENTYGTGAFALLNTGKRRICSKHGLITTIGCDARGGPAYVLEGAIFIAGAAIQWLRDGLHLFESARETADLARSIPDNGGVYFVPALTGLGAPHWEPEARGCISGLTRGTTDAHLVRAALEAMAYQTRDVLEAMEKDSGLTVRRLKVGGGAAANDFLCQFQADLLGRPVVRAAHTESTALGAAYLAGLATGYWKSSRDITATWKQDREFSPVLSPAEAMSLYKGWKAALKRTVL